MALTYTLRSGDPVNIGGTTRLAELSIALDSSYPAGGESITPSEFGFSQFDMVMCEPSMGYTFEYDHTNDKLKAYRRAPAIVVEEKHTSSSKALTLDYPAAWIMAVSKADTGMVQVKSATSTANLGTNEWCVSTTITDGERTTLWIAASATVYVTYVTQAWDDVYNLLVQDEVTTAVAAGTTLDNTIWGFGYVAKATGTSLVPITDSDTAATGEVNVDLNTKTAALKFHASSSATVYYVTYLKAPAANSWLADRLVSDENTSTGLATAFDKNVALWLYSGYALTSAATANKIITRGGTMKTKTCKIFWGDSKGTAQANAFADQGTPYAGLGAGSGICHDAFYVDAKMWEIPTVPLEVPNGTDLSNVTGLRCVIIGR